MSKEMHNQCYFRKLPHCLGLHAAAPSALYCYVNLRLYKSVFAQSCVVTWICGYEAAPMSCISKRLTVKWTLHKLSCAAPHVQWPFARQPTHAAWNRDRNLKTQIPGRRAIQHCGGHDPGLFALWKDYSQVQCASYRILSLLHIVRSLTNQKKIFKWSTIGYAIQDGGCYFIYTIWWLTSTGVKSWQLKKRR